MSKRSRLGLIGSVAALATTGPLQAQTVPPADALATGGDIVVTAQRREERLQDVALSISVLGEGDLRAATVKSITDLQYRFSNVAFNPATTIRSFRIGIRGITSEANNVGIDPSIPVSVDGVTQGRPATVGGQLFDVQRIEVLRGPQGTLYGMNAIAGAINIISRQPELGKLSGDFLGTVGNYDLFTTEGAINVPFGDKVALRASALWSRRDGFIQNTLQGTTQDSVRSLAGRAQLLLVPTDGIRVTLRASASRDRGRPAIYDIRDTLGNQARTPAALGAARDADPNDRNVLSDFTSFARRNVWAVSGEANVDIGSHVLTAITAYQGYEHEDLNDTDQTNLNVLRSGVTEDQRQFSQEIRLASPAEGFVSYVVGGQYFFQDVDSSVGSFLGPDARRIGIPPAALPASVQTRANLKVEDLGVFAQTTVNLADAFRITGGLRYSAVTKRLDYFQPAAPLFALPFLTSKPVAGTTALQTVPNRRKDNKLQWSIGAEVNPVETVLIYGRIATGFKAGGFNVSTNSNNGISYEPERLVAYEGGIKTQFVDNLVTLNLAYFRYDYRDLQVNSLIVNPGIPPRIEASNAGQARTEGLELEATVRPRPWLTLGANWGFLPVARYTSYRNATSGGANFTGNRIPLAPRHTLALSADVEGPTVGMVKPYFHIDYSYRSPVFRNPNNDRLVIHDSISVTNGRFGLRSDNGRYEVAVWGKNLFNDVYSVNTLANSFFTGRGQILGPPRQYGLELGVRF